MKLFKPLELVTIIGVNDKALNGSIGTVCGIASKHAEFTMYIVELTEKTKEGWTHITLPDSCLELLF